MRKAGPWSMAALATAMLAIVSMGAGKPEPKYSIEEVMQKAHSGKTNLAAKLGQGKLTDKEKTLLIEYYEALGQNKPPRGDAGAWEKRTGDLLAAAKLAVNGSAADKAKFKKAANCKACHD